METYSLIPIHLGRIQLDLGIMTYRRNYGIKEWLPIISWYIKAQGKHILVDTGISAQESYYYTDSPVQDIVDFEGGLRKVGISSGDVDLIIQTHLHFDHVGNTHRCKKARVIVQKKELQFALSPHPLQGYLYDPKLLNCLRFELVTGDQEVVPGIQVIHLPGHTPGIQAVSVNTAKGKAIISGMCCIKENFDPPKLRPAPQQHYDWKVVPPGNFINLYDAYESMLKLKGMADILIPQHDPSLLEVEKIP